MDWLKRLLGSKGGTPPPDEAPTAPPTPAGEEEAALQEMIDAGFDARTAFFSRLGEVSPDVIRQLTGEAIESPRTIDLRAIISDHARGKGVRHISQSPSCTRCDNNRFFSHRAGDAGRQVAVIMAS